VSFNTAADIVKAVVAVDGRDTPFAVAVFERAD
jgi:hypothetical protein